MALSEKDPTLGEDGRLRSALASRRILGKQIGRIDEFQQSRRRRRRRDIRFRNGAACLGRPTCQSRRLRCEVSAGLGLIITSSKELSCAFTSMHGWREHYYGRIHKFGLDLGATDGAFSPGTFLLPSRDRGVTRSRASMAASMRRRRSA